MTEFIEPPISKKIIPELLINFVSLISDIYVKPLINLAAQASDAPGAANISVVKLLIVGMSLIRVV